MNVKQHTISVRHALDGVRQAFTTQPNFRIHLFLSAGAVFLGIVLRIDHWEWIILSLVITVGLVIEMINTAIESVVDLISSQWHLAAKTAKDVSAGAMLIYAIGSMILAGLLFAPKILWLFI